VTFKEVMDQIITWLQQDQRVSYRALKRQFTLEDDYLEDLKVELIEVKQVAVDQDGKMLVWRGETASTAASAPTGLPQHAPLAYTPSYLAEKILTSKSALEGERKQVTVLFADLKGSMELLADRDPEEAQQLLDPVLERMMAAVHRYEGTVNQVMGDGIMALFGAPLAHEDHAVRACYAALAMHEALRRYSAEVRRTHGVEVQIRVGLNSGEVVVRAIGNDLHMDYSAIGQTTHLAARMEQLATPGTIRMTAATLRLVEGLVQATALGPIPVKGLDEPVDVFELVGASGLRRRLQAAAVRGLTRFVGRDTELTAIVEALRRAAAGHGQVVALVGEAGVGKSRLVYECVHSPHTQGWRVLESASVSYGKATPYFPVIELLKRYAQVEERDDTRTIRAKVTDRVVTLDPALQDAVPALLVLLDALAEDSPFHRLEPPQRRERTLDALTRVVLRESQVQPLLVVFEDLHWIDSETHALLQRLVEHLPTARLVLLVNYRPEYQPDWGSESWCTHVRLDPLPPASADALLQALLGDAPSLGPLTRLLIERTAGNPFFLEESVRTLAETGVLTGARGTYQLAQALPTIQVPATVQAMLAARIDRLPPEEKDLLQTAAVIGTEVPFLVLCALTAQPDETLYRGLAHLQAAEFLDETRLFPHLDYTFKHALTHEVAYGSLLLERRRTLHAQIVTCLEALALDRLAEQVDRLAHHAVRGEVWEKAVTYCRQAGTKALEHSAFREALAAFEQALAALQRLPESAATRALAIDLRLDVRHALHPLAEAGRSIEYLRQAESLAEALGDARRLGQIAGLLPASLWQLGDLHGSLAAAQRALTLATALGDVSLQVSAQTSLGQSYWALSHHGQAVEVFRRNIALLQGGGPPERFGLATVPVVSSHGFLTWSLAELGAFAEGRAHGEDAIRLGEALKHPFSLAFAYAAVGHLALRQGVLRQAIRVLEPGLTLGEVRDLQLMIQLCKAQLGAAYALCGRVSEALPLLEQALEQSVATRVTIASALYAVWLGEGYVLADRVAEARQLGQGALEASRTRKQQGHQAYALRLLGEIAGRGTPPDVEMARTYYRQALALAEDLDMRPLQAHCHYGLGTLYTKTDRADQACTALSTALDLYRAMDMAFWLPQTEAALAQVEGR
jgi:class 3 adenylate cyclase/tetratricopeptide (TPR) repeat protein